MSTLSGKRVEIGTNLQTAWENTLRYPHSKNLINEYVCFEVDLKKLEKTILGTDPRVWRPQHPVKTNKSSRYMEDIKQGNSLEMLDLDFYIRPMISEGLEVAYALLDSGYTSFDAVCTPENIDRLIAAFGVEGAEKFYKDPIPSTSGS